MAWSWEKPSAISKFEESCQSWFQVNRWWLNWLQLIVIVFIVIILIVAFQKNNWADWTDFKDKKLWDWLKLLGVPLTLAILSYFLQQQEKRRSRDAAKRQQEIAANEAKDEILQAYFDRLSVLLVDKNILAIASKIYQSKSEEEKKDTSSSQDISSEDQELFDVAIDVIRARTLSILRRFEGDSDRKTSVIQFLAEAEVISKARLNLSQSNLSGVNFVGINLSNTDLSAANLSNAELSLVKLIGVELTCADLSNANLWGADLSNAELWGADLSNANLNDAELIGANLEDIQWSSQTIWPDKDKVAKALNIPENLKQELGIEPYTKSESTSPDIT
ncbi:MAG: pentapeptide repeat-containing protein [Cyanobacteria bacterium P01_D01_bin.156]